MSSKSVRFVAPLCLLLTITCSLALPSHSTAAQDAATSAGGAAPPTTDTVVGVAAAVACGLGLRFAPVVLAAGAIPVAVVVGSCALMILDGMGTPD